MMENFTEFFNFGNQRIINKELIYDFKKEINSKLKKFQIYIFQTKIIVVILHLYLLNLGLIMKSL